LNLPNSPDSRGYAESQSNGGFTGSYWPAMVGAQAGQGTFGLKEPYFTEFYNTAANTNPYPRVAPTSTDFYGDRESFVGQGNPNACQKIVDWGYRFLYETPVNAKKIIKQYYGIEPKKSYYWGTSCGGKEGQISAQKFPELYDGFFIGYPLGGHMAVTYRGTWDTYWGAGLLKQVPGGGTIYSRYKAPLLYKTVYDKCDAVDGLVDGIIDDPTKCKLDTLTEIPTCNDAEEAAEAAGDYKSTCFTLAQRQAIAEIYAGPHDSSGKAWYPGQPLSAEFVTRSGSLGLSAALADAMGVPMFPFIALDPPEGPNFDITKINWDTLPVAMQQTICEQKYDDGSKEIFNIHNAIDGITISPKPTFNMGGLDTVYKKGAKIVQTHGWADALVTPLAASRELYENELKARGVEKTKSFWKLYLVPGAGHGGGGLSAWPANEEVFNAMVDWVENGIEPAAVIGSRNANVDANYLAARTRPSCPYPEVARWNGSEAASPDGIYSGMNWAGNFSCVPPVTVKIEPETLNLKSKGEFTAKISVPEGYDIEDWNIHAVSCEGATAVKGTIAGNTYVAKFKRQDLKNVQAGEAVTLTVSLAFHHDGKDALTQASDTVRATK
jgi:hypothetical protein